MSEEPATQNDPITLARQLSDDNGKLRAYAVKLEAQIQRLTVERDEANYQRQIHLNESRDMQKRLENALSDFQLAHEHLQLSTKREQALSIERDSLDETIDQLRAALRDATTERNELLERYQSAIADYSDSVSRADRYYDAMRVLARIVAEE
jgi:DNA repair exonuclease SbcCD ATPase subunit